MAVTRRWPAADVQLLMVSCQWLPAANGCQPLMVSWAAGLAGLRPEGVEGWFPCSGGSCDSAAGAGTTAIRTSAGGAAVVRLRQGECSARTMGRLTFVDPRREKVPMSPERGAAAWAHVLAAQSEGLDGSADVLAGKTRNLSRDLLPPHFDHILGISVFRWPGYTTCMLHAAAEMCAMALELQQTVQGDVASASARKCRAATSKVTATSREMQCLRESLPCGRGLLCKCRCKQPLRSSGCLSRVLGQSKQVNAGGVEPQPWATKVKEVLFFSSTMCIHTALHGRWIWYLIQPGRAAHCDWEDSPTLNPKR